MSEVVALESTIIYHIEPRALDPPSFEVPIPQHLPNTAGRLFAARSLVDGEDQTCEPDDDL